MSDELLRPKRTSSSFSGTAQSHTAHRAIDAMLWHRVALAGVLLLSAFLGFFQLDREGPGNPYYAATVKSMLASWHNFFFVSFDPGGFVTVDKPPLGLWIQAASAAIFGFRETSLFLPQVVAAILSVGLLYYLVRRAFGPTAGLLAALVLALMPINVVTSRDNRLDPLLTLALLVGAWTILRAAETGRLRWLMACAVVVGLGFNIKMLQAYLVMPAFGLLYVLVAPLPWSRRLLHGALASVVLLAVSLSWAAAVDLTPADQRPYIGGSTNNTVMNLIIDYNGVKRVTGGVAAVPLVPAQLPPSAVQLPPLPQGRPLPGAQPSIPAQAGAPAADAGAEEEVGTPGLLRLLNHQLAGQIGWLLPLAIGSLVVAAGRLHRSSLRERRAQSLILWGAWFLTQAIFFSIASFYHRTYLVMLSPAIAALVGIGVVALWEDAQRQGWRRWLLPATLLATVSVQLFILASYPQWSQRLTPWIAGLALLAVLGLVITQVRPVAHARRWSALATMLAMLALLIAPTTWIAIAVWSPPDEFLPVAGPRDGAVFSGVTSGGNVLITLDIDKPIEENLISYLQARQGTSKFLAATRNIRDASPLILETGKPVMAINGFSVDHILTTEQLKQAVAQGDVRFFVINPLEPSISSTPEEDPLTWVQSACARVSPQQWQSARQQVGQVGRLVYDCSEFMQ